MRSCRQLAVTSAVLLILVFAAVAPDAQAKRKFKDPSQSRAEYIARLQVQQANVPKTTPGSLWFAGGALTDPAGDYKARQLGDTVTLLVALQTDAVSAGNLNSQRTFQTSSSVTGLPGGASTSWVNPLFGAQSGTTIQGQGTSSNTSTLTTSLAARVIAVLPNRDLVVEAQREVFMNNQHETMFVRGVLRPGDIGPNDTAASTSLANLEIELKGKGIISDAIDRPKGFMRALLWLFNF
jgi:flagellar L-ring protein precursor FlgH